jgi:DNA-binding TFAR19-related protein (PDSD5 family)
MQNQNQERQKLQEQLEQLELFAKQRMSPEAISRYGNLKAAHPEKAIQSIAIITQMVNEGKVQGMVSDEEYKKLLQYMTPEKKEFKITRK